MAAALVSLLAAAGYGFVLKSIPYQTPQLPPPRAVLTAQEISSFAAYRPGLREVPVLTWRDVSLRPGKLVTTPLRFATELAVLRSKGFRSIRLGALAALASGRHQALPPRPVLLTFDDGLSTDWTTVDPILRLYGFTAVVFIDPADVALKSPSYFLTQQELRAMAASGRWQVGVQLGSRWRSGPAAARSTARAASALQSEAGSPVTAYAWPALEVASARGLRAPRAFYRAQKRHFAEVFGRPEGGPGDFVVTGSMRHPLPRMNVTAADTLPQLSLRLRIGVRGPPPSDPLTLPWRSAGGTCHASARTVKLRTRHFALCTIVANGSQWRDYGLHTGVVAHAGVTAIVELRDSTKGCIEVAVGMSRVSIKQRIGHHWSVLRQVVAPLAALPDSTGPTLLGAGVAPVTVRVTGSLLRVQADGLTIRQRVSSAVRHGIIALGLVSPGGRKSVTYRRPAVITPSRP
jgi:peptidoglycan/xylan/chitin deacetylase (PgdA/CDA1 family)